MKNVKDGWGTMAVATFFIYVMLIFLSTNPKPLAYRIEHIPNFAVVSVTLLSFYAVFITSLIQKRKLSDLFSFLNKRNGMQWHIRTDLQR